MFHSQLLIGVTNAECSISHSLHTPSHTTCGFHTPRQEPWHTSRKACIMQHPLFPWWRAATSAAWASDHRPPFLVASLHRCFLVRARSLCSNRDAPECPTPRCNRPLSGNAFRATSSHAHSTPHHQLAAAQRRHRTRSCRARSTCARGVAPRRASIALTRFAAQRAASTDP